MSFADRDGVIWLDGELVPWETFASGKAIVRRFGKLASEIDDPAIWKIISRDLALGIIDMAANIQPDVIIIGGGVGTHFKKYGGGRGIK